MRVPVRLTPQTRPLGGSANYAEANSTLGRASAGLGDALGQVADNLDKAKELARQEIIKKQALEASQLYVQETIDLDKDFTERQKQAPLGAEGFSSSVEADYAKRHEGILTQMKSAGVNEEVVSDLDTRLKVLRANLAAKALDFQDKSYRVKVDADLDKSEQNLLALTYENELHQKDAENEYFDQLDLTNLTAVEKQARWEKFQLSAAMATAAGIGAKDPKAMIKALGGNNPITVFEATGKVEPSSSTAEKVLGSLIQQESSGRAGAIGPQTQYGRAYGLTQVLDTTGAGVAKRLGITWQPELMRGTSSEAAEYQKKIGKAYFEEGLAKYKGDVKAALMFYHGGPDERKWGPKTRAYAEEVLGRIKKEIASPEARAEFDSNPPEIEDRFKIIPLSQRLQLIEKGQNDIEHLQRIDAQVREQQYDDKYNSLMTGILDGSAGRSELEAAKKEGWLNKYQDIDRVENALEQREKKNTDLTNYNTALATPGFVWNPYDDDQKKAVDAAVKEGGGSIQVGAAVWEKTGILSKTTATQLRGGLVSTDPKMVGQTANIAGNMINKNPNAFAAVEGGKDIEEAALLFNHYVYDLGYDPQQASNLVAQSNNPELAKKVKVAEPEINKLQGQFAKDGVDVGKKVFDGKEFIGPLTKDAIGDSYAELVIQGMKSGKSQGQAEAIAAKQLLKVYGPDRYDRIRPYPAERGYPAINGTHDYLYSEAAKLAGDYMGMPGKVPVAAVNLAPIPGMTDQDFRSGRPPRYRITVKKNIDGQEILDTIPGVFVADVQGAAKKGQEDNKQRMDYQRVLAGPPTRRKISQSNPIRPDENLRDYNARVDQLENAAKADWKKLKETTQTRPDIKAEFDSGYLKPENDYVGAY